MNALLFDDESLVLKNMEANDIIDLIEQAENRFNEMNIPQRPSFIHTHSLIPLLTLLLHDSDQVVYRSFKFLERIFEYIDHAIILNKYMDLIRHVFDSSIPEIHKIFTTFTKSALSKGKKNVILQYPDLIVLLVQTLKSPSISFFEDNSKLLLDIFNDEPMASNEFISNPAIHNVLISFKDNQSFDSQAMVRFLDFMCRLSTASIVYWEWCTKTFGLLDYIKDLLTIHNSDPLILSNIIICITRICSISSSYCRGLEDSGLISMIMDMIPLEPMYEIDCISLSEVMNLLQVVGNLNDLIVEWNTRYLILPRIYNLFGIHNQSSVQNIDILSQAMIASGSLMHHIDILQDQLASNHNMLNEVVNDFLMAIPLRIPAIHTLTIMFKYNKSIQSDYLVNLWSFICEKAKQKRIMIPDYLMKLVAIPLPDIYLGCYDLILHLTKFSFIINEFSNDNEFMKRLLLRDYGISCIDTARYKYDIIKSILNHPQCEQIISESLIHEMHNYVSHGLYYTPPVHQVMNLEQ